MKKNIFVVLLILIVLGGIYYYKHSIHCIVYVNNEPAVCLANADAANKIINDIKSDYAVKYGQAVTVIEKISVKKGSGEKPVSEEKAKKILRSRITPGVEGFAVIADGRTVCGFKNKEEAGRFLVYSKNKFTPSEGDYEEPEFKEKVLITGTLVDPNLIFDSSEEAFDGVFKNKAKIGGRQYIVKKGETASHIAGRCGLTLKELSELNPGYNLNRIRPGDVLNISADKKAGCMTVVVRQEKTVIVTVKPKVTKVSSEMLPYGKTKVINPGKPGKKETRYAVCYNNGVEVSKEIISEEYIVMPINRQVAIGIKAFIP